MAGRAEAGYDLAADMGMGCLHIAQRGGEAGADGPHRLIGNDQPFGIVGQRAGKLAAEHGFGLAGIALHPRFADAQDHLQFRGAASHGFGAHVGIGLAIVTPPLAVANDDEARAQISQHRGRHAAGMGAFRVAVAILAADLHRAGRNDHRAINEREGRRDPDARTSLGRAAASHGGDLGDILAQAIHLPVADDQGRHCRFSTFWRCLWQAARVVTSGAFKPSRIFDARIFSPFAHQLARARPVRVDPGGLCHHRRE